MTTAKYQVFVSSTFDDLRAERDQVIKAVLEMGHIPVGMEMFSAADEQQWQIIKRHIDESDYYVVIVAHRYGSIIDGISYTRKEYEYAVSQGVPVLGFIIDSSASWPTDRVDKDTPTQELLQDFKAVIRDKPTGFWGNAEELHAKFCVALIKAITVSPRDGWVRATSIAGPEVTAELSRLSAENARLRNELVSATKVSAADKNKAMNETFQILHKQKRTVSYRYTPREQWRNDADEFSLAWLFEALAPSCVQEYSVYQCSRLLALNIQKGNEMGQAIVPINAITAILSDYMALDLMYPSERKHSVQDKEEYWSLSELGVELLQLIRRYDLTSDARSAGAEAISKTPDSEAAPTKKPAPAS